MEPAPVSDWETYHRVRLPDDRRRTVLWQTLVLYFFQRYADEASTVLDIGAGRCDFINNIRAAKKYALDPWPGIRECAAPDVEAIVGDLSALSRIAEDSLDLVFASNIFEHLTQDALRSGLDGLLPRMKRGARLVAMQPNYRYAYREYFDDYTHVTVWSHESLCDFLMSAGYSIERVVPRFLPISLKSRLPVHPWLIRAYLAAPLKPFGKQMLVVARPR